MLRLLLLLIVLSIVGCSKKRSTTGEVFIHAFSSGNREYLTLKNNQEFWLQRSSGSPTGGTFRMNGDSIFLIYHEPIPSVLPDSFVIVGEDDSLVAVYRGHFFKLKIAEQTAFRGF